MKMKVVCPTFPVKCYIVGLIQSPKAIQLYSLLLLLFHLQGKTASITGIISQLLGIYIWSYELLISEKQSRIQAELSKLHTAAVLVQHKLVTGLV